MGVSIETTDPAPVPITDPNLWHWVATYADGRTVEQYHDRDEHGNLIGFADLNHRGVRTVELRPAPGRPDLPALVVLVNWERGVRPVCFSRPTETKCGQTWKTKSIERVWCLGICDVSRPKRPRWSLMWAREDGIVALTDGEEGLDLFGAPPSLPWLEET